VRVFLWMWVRVWALLWVYGVGIHMRSKFVIATSTHVHIHIPSKRECNKEEKSLVNTNLKNGVTKNITICTSDRNIYRKQSEWLLNESTSIDILALKICCC